MLFPKPASPLRNMTNWLCSPLVFNLWSTLFIFRVAVLPMVCPRHEYKLVFRLFPSWTKPRRNVHAIISYAMYCFSSSVLFSSLATFIAVSGKGWYFVYICILVHTHGIGCDWRVCFIINISIHVYFFVVYTPYQNSTYELQHGRKVFTYLLN